MSDKQKYRSLSKNFDFHEQHLCSSCLRCNDIIEKEKDNR